MAEVDEWLKDGSDMPELTQLLRDNVGLSPHSADSRAQTLPPPPPTSSATPLPGLLALGNTSGGFQAKHFTYF